MFGGIFARETRALIVGCLIIGRRTEAVLKIGVYICHCGMNIAPKVDAGEVARFAGGLDHVRIARDYKFMCSKPGQEFIRNDILELGIDRVVVL